MNKLSWQAGRLASGPAAALVLLAGFVLIWLVWQLARPLALLVVAASLAAGLSPLSRKLERRLPRIVAVLLVYLIVLLLMVFIFIDILPTVIEQFQQAVAVAPDIIERAMRMINRWDGIQDLSLFELLAPAMNEMSTLLVTLPFTLATAIFEIVMIFVLSVYLQLEAPRMRRFLLTLFPEMYRPRVDEVSRKMLEAMGGYVQGTLLTALIVGVLTYVGLLLLGIEFALALAMLAGMLEIIPTLGPILAAVPMILVALLDSPSKALLVLLFVTILQQLESHVIMPNVMRARVHISPLLIILAVLAGASLGGLLGVLAAIPLVAALSVFVQEVGVPWTRSWLEEKLIIERIKAGSAEQDEES